MGLREKLNHDLKEAMRAKQGERRDTLRLLLAAIKQSEVDEQTELGEDEIEALLFKQAKQRHESITAYEKADREDLAGPERAELVIIEAYLPQMMSREEIEAIAREIIDRVGADSPKSMGAVMGQLMPQVKGKADGRLVNQVVRELLGG